VGYCIDGAVVGDSWKNITLLFNGSRKDIKHPLPKGNFRIVFNGDDFREENQGEIVSDEVKLGAVSMMMLVKTED
jgi:hypothetical protein